MRHAIALGLALLSAPPLWAACDAPEHRQFDFWGGDWSVTSPDGKLAGSNRIDAVLDGCALHENWSGARGTRGHSYNAWDAARGVWHQTWVDSNGTLLLLEGGLKEGSMVLEGTQQTAKGTVRNRITWTPIDDGVVRQLWEVSEDQGKTWSIVFDGRYRKK